MSEPHLLAGAQGKRASIACVACRSRRTKCVVNDGQVSCRYCQKMDLVCVATEDERKRSTSKAYIDSLRSRIQELEDMVQRQNQYNLSVERIPDDGLPDAENIMPRSVIHANGFPKLASPPQSMDIERNDKFTGFNNPTLERYLPLSASTIEIGDQSFDFDKSQLATGPFNIAGVAAEESDYLMTLYWDQHAPTLPIVDKTLYLESKRQHSTDYYSLFLELCMLALGLKLADPNEAVLRHCRRQRKENLLYEQARKVYEETVGHCPDIPALQAMLLLEDLESRMGNIELARAISGMYCATMLYGLFFLAITQAVQTNSPWRSEGLSQTYQKIKVVALVYNLFWSTYLTHPEKSHSLHAIAEIVERFGSIPEEIFGASPPPKMDPLYQWTLLVGLSCEISLFRQLDHNPNDPGAYIEMANYDASLDKWFNELPSPLKWTPDNILLSSKSFFLLHQHYHSTLIHLHQQFSKTSISDDQNEVAILLSNISREICLNSAVRLAEIISEHHNHSYRQEHISLTEFQHILKASIVLKNGISMSENPNERSIYLQHLKNLSSLFDSGLSDYPSFNVQMLDILDYASTSSSNSISNANNGSINARISNSSALKVGNRQPVHSDRFYGDYQLVGQLNPFLENWEGRASLLDEALLLGLGVLGQ